jgi:small-conductance mechanosensitive channel
MSARRWIVPLLLVLLSAATGLGLWFTRDTTASAPLVLAGERPAGAEPGAPAGAAPAAGKTGEAAGKTGEAAGKAGDATAKPASGKRDKARPQRRQRPFDLAVLLTARRLAGLAQQPEELELAQQAQRVADHAVDLAFADTLQRIAEEPAPQTPELRALAEAKAKAKAAVDAASAQVEALGGEEGKDGGDGAAEHVEVARARLELARDELANATEDLARAGGDPEARIQALRAQYEAAQKVPAAAPAPVVTAGAAPEPVSLLARLRAWRSRREKVAALEDARGEVLTRVEAMDRWRGRVEKRIQEAEALEGKPAVAGAKAEPADDQRAEALRKVARDRRRLTSLGRRLQDHQELAEVYADWSAVAGAQARTALHQVLLRGVWVLVAAALAWILGLLADRAFARRAKTDQRAGTLHGMARVAIQLVALLVIVFIALGTPGQVSTILGLAGAGLTVAMKDFIVAFFGWFVLMGRNGIRVGDWVEIKGVGGEVVEIGLFHTVLLETGSWSEAGHPTGRRVSFVNSFAIEGHYFDFTTSGQWMWDALQVLVPLGQDPYPVIDGVRALVEHETEANSKEAEQEWSRAAARYRVRTFSAVPGINVVPTGNGVQLDVRYITRARERHETRRRLYAAVVELMHGKREAVG